MGIISKTSDSVVKQPKPFPKLMRQYDRDRIVLFESRCHGTVIKEDKSSCLHIGYFSTTWEMSAFEDYEGTITLSNE